MDEAGVMMTLHEAVDYTEVEEGWDMDEAQLTISGRFARGVLDNLLEGCQVISPDFRYLYVNKAVVKHGRTAGEQLIGRTMMEAYPGIEHTPMFALLRECMADRAPRQLENEFVFPDGMRGWFDLRFEPVPEGVLVLSIEITERKRAEESLRRTNRALATLSECNQTLVRAADERAFVQDVCGIVVRSGYRMAWIGLAQKDELKTVRPLAAAGMDKGYTDALHVTWDDSPRGRGPTGKAIRSGEAAVARHIPTDPGFAPWREEALSRGFASSIALPFRIAGEIAGAFNIYAVEPDAFDTAEQALLAEMALDLGYGITALRERAARVRADEELREVYERCHLLFEHAPVGIAVQSEGKVVFANPACARILGAGSPQEITGLSFTEIMHPPNLGAPQDRIRRLSAGESEFCPVEDLYVRRDGSLVSVEVIAVPLTFMGKPAVQVVVTDITERKQTEEQLRLAQKMEAVGRLAGGVAHDFNNLLSVILNCADFAGESLREGTPSHGYIKEIVKAAEHAAALTRQLLAFSRKQVLEPRVLELNSVAADLEKMLRRLIGEDIDFVQRLAPDLGRVKADPGQIEQVIMNLVVNARDAMPFGGKLTIETTDVELDEEHTARHVAVNPGSYILLAVSDTGCGMDEATRQRVFEPFFTTKEQGKGTGLGLSTVYGIVKQSGGNIRVCSEPGKGTTFKVYLPRVVEEPAPTVTSRGPEGPAMGTETILVVEDEEGVRNLTARILRKAGYKVLVASHGGEALLACEAHVDEIHLLLTDVVMPKMSGRELAERIRKVRPGLKVLYMSGYTDNAIVHHGVLNPGTRFIGKPFNAAMLASKVREVLDEP